MTKELGKIQSVRFGAGGYQDAMLGFTFNLVGKGWGTFTFRGAWGPGIEASPDAKWTEADRMRQYAEAVRYVGQLLKDAKAETLEDLAGTPIEAEVDINEVKSWRILTEVL